MFEKYKTVAGYVKIPVMAKVAMNLLTNFFTSLICLKHISHEET